MDDDDDDGAAAEARDGGCGKIVACSLLFWLCGIGGGIGMDRIVSGVAEKTATSAPSATTADDTVADAAVLLLLLLLSI
jgi:hypothetical protein